MVAKLYALFGVTVLSGAVYADVCHAPRAVYQHQAVAVVAPVAVSLPLYGASYTGGDGETAEALRAILEELKAMRQELAGLRGGAAGPQAVTAKNDPDPILVKHCAACHTDGPNVKGDFGMFDDKGILLKLNGPDKRAVVKRVREGTMPPAGKPRLTVDEKATVETFAISPAPAAPPKK